MIKLVVSQRWTKQGQLENLVLLRLFQVCPFEEAFQEQFVNDALSC